MSDIFVSYTHEDKEYLDLLKRVLFTLEVDTWDDSRIQAGEVWKEEIDTALRNTKVALFLVSIDFLGSEFIKRVELPTLLKRAEEEGIMILWILLRKVVKGSNPLERYQALNTSLDHPLHEFIDADPGKRDDELVWIGDQVSKAVARWNQQHQKQPKAQITKPETKTEQDLDYNIIEVTRAHKDKIPELYQAVFVGPPWNEYKCCVLCGTVYSESELEKREPNAPCSNVECLSHINHKPLECIDYWHYEKTLSVFIDALNRDGFIGAVAQTKANNLLGFSWGFALPQRDAVALNTPTVNFSELLKQLEAAILPKDVPEIDLGRTFYCAESGVLPNYQKKGLGTQLAYARFRLAREKGFVGVTYRSVNPAMDKIYFRCFGEEHVYELFRDITTTEKRIWRYAELAHLVVRSDWLEKTKIPGI